MNNSYLRGNSIYTLFVPQELHIFEPNDRLLFNRDLPDLTQTFSIKEGLSPALSLGLPISFERGYFPTSPLYRIHTKIS